MKYVLISILLLVPIRIKYQAIYTDCRDGQQYKIVRIGNLDWFAEDLRYVAPKSWCEENPSPLCDETNYYSHTELDSICPCEWRIPTREEWVAAIDAIKLARGIAADSAVWETVVDTYTSKKKEFPNYFIEDFHILHDSSNLQVVPVGWVQGKKLENTPDHTTYWVNDQMGSHIHFSHRTLIHSHEHHIVDKPRKVRRFQIRCVRDIK